MSRVRIEVRGRPGRALRLTAASHRFTPKGYTLLASVSLLLLVSCVTPGPKPQLYYHEVSTDDTGLAIDRDLLASAKLSEDQKRSGEDLLLFFHSAESSLESYIDALEKNLETTETLGRKYGTADAIVGGVSGLSSPAIIFATAAVAVPIAGAIWIAIGQSIQQFKITPEIEKARAQLKDARRLLDLLPDTVAAFRGLVFADTEAEATKRFRHWHRYLENVKHKVLHFFSASERPPS